MSTSKSIMIALLVSAAGAPSVVVANDSVSQTAVQAEALKLANVLVAVNVSDTVVESALTQMTRNMFADQPDLAALNELYPGIDRVFLDTMRPFINAEMQRIKPLYEADLADLFGRNFDAAELRKLTEFWQSAPAQAVLKSAIANIDYAAISKEVVGQITSDETITISADAMETDLRGGVQKAGKEINLAERDAFVRFALSPVGRKFIKLKDEKRVIDVKWTNGATSPEIEKQMETSIIKALEDHIRKFDERKTAAAVS